MICAEHLLYSRNWRKVKRPSALECQWNCDPTEKSQIVPMWRTHVGRLVSVPIHCTCADWLLIMQSSREELLDDIEELKKKVTGSADKLSS